MIKSHYDRFGLLLSFFACALFLFSSVESSPQIVSVLFLLSLIVYYFFCNQNNIIPSQIKYIIYSFIAFFVTTIFNMLVNDSLSYGLRIFNLPLGYVVAAIILILMIRLNVILYEKIIFYAVLIACFVNGLIAIFQRALGFLHDGRVYGFSSIAAFSNLSSVLTLCAFAYFLGAKISLKEKVLFGVGIGLSLFAVIFGQTRGVMLALTAGFVLILALFVWFESKRRSIILKQTFLLVLLGGILLGLIPQVRDSLNARFGAVKTDLLEYEGNNYETSLGLRFEMWKEAIAITKLSPIIGLSPKSICERKYEIKELAKSARDPANLDCYGRYHNEVLNTLARKGILGLFALLAVWLSIGVFFYKQISRGNKIPAIAMLGILISYIVSGGSGEPMNSFMDANFFLMICIIFASLALKKPNNATN